MLDSGRSLLERRLIIVTGKGGTGKTTVAATLAVASARAGQRVLVVEVGRDEQIPRLFAKNPKPVGYAGRRVAPGITAMRIDPFEALSEYLGLQIRVQSVVDLVLNNAAFRQLMSATPGWRELITLGKIWHLERMRDGRGRPRYDLIVVDAPATGHGVTFLDAPRVVVSAVRAGPLRRQAFEVETLIEDPERCVLLPVALAEELPARETAELVERLTGEVGVAVERVIVNAVVAEPFSEPLADLDDRLSRLAASGGSVHPELPASSTLALCASYLKSRSALNRHYVDVIGRLTGLPLTLLPQLTNGVRTSADLETLSSAFFRGADA